MSWSYGAIPRWRADPCRAPLGCALARRSLLCVGFGGFPRLLRTLWRLLHLRQTLLQSAHQIGNWSHLRLGNGRDFAAFQVRLDQLLQVLLEGVVIFARIKLS